MDAFEDGTRAVTFGLELDAIKLVGEVLEGGFFADGGDDHDAADEGVGMGVADGGECDVRELFVIFEAFGSVAGDEGFEPRGVAEIFHDFDGFVAKHAGEVDEFGVRMNIELAVAVAKGEECDGAEDGIRWAAIGNGIESSERCWGDEKVFADAVLEGVVTADEGVEGAGLGGAEGGGCGLRAGGPAFDILDGGFVGNYFTVADDEVNAPAECDDTPDGGAD